MFDLKKIILNENDVVPQYNRMAYYYFKHATIVYDRFSKILLTTITLACSFVTILIFWEIMTTHSFLGEFPLYHLIIETIECLLLEATLVTLVVTILRARKCSKYEALYGRFTILGLLHEYGIETAQLTDRETQLAVYQRLITDTQFPPKTLLKVFNTLCDSKLTKEDIPKSLH